MNGVTVLGMLVCYLLVPVINNAKDTDNMGLWNGLHMVTVGVTVVILVGQLGYGVRWYRTGVVVER
ncbi:MAG: hypothetical protein AAGA96_00355 [Verrucomicrobiota bacterium]